jgi:hypothetical protein
MNVIERPGRRYAWSSVKVRGTARSVSWLAIAAVLGLVWLPPEHVHEADHDGDHSEVVHRHFAPHHHDDSGAIFDHQDTDARYLSSPFTVPDSQAHGRPDTPAVTATLILPQPHIGAGWTLVSLHVRVHDPPWASSTGLRAPPSFTRHV